MKSTGRLAFALFLALPTTGHSQPMPRHTAVSILAASPAPELDLSIRHYSRIITTSGVVRENRHEETMLRRHNHVWLTRVLPKQLARNKPQLQTVAWHAEIGFELMPRHMSLENGKLKLELIDTDNRTILTTTPADYSAINFDGSWSNTYYLLDPGMAATLFQAKSTPGTRWRSREKNGYFERILWDEQHMIPLVIEAGNRDGSFFRRTEVQIRKKLASDLPLKNLETYTRKEYAWYAKVSG